MEMHIKIRTFTLSKWTGQVVEERIPSLFSFFPIDKPGIPLSTMKQVMPLYPCNIEC